MSSAPRSGWDRSNLSNKTSAGGQLEHPSDVNNSTSTGVRGVWSLVGPGSVLAARICRNETIIRAQVMTSPLIENLKRIMFSLSAYRFGERESLFLGYQETRLPTGGNLYGVSERLFAAFRRCACFQSLHRRKINFGNAVESRNTLRGAEYLGCDNLGLAAY